MEILKSELLTELETRDLDDKNFVLLSPLRYRSKILNGIIEAEYGFVSDGSSTPRVPIIFELYGDVAHREGVLHDRIYRAKDHIMKIYQDDGTFVETFIPKHTADSVFKEIMIVRNKPFYQKEGMWLGVVIGGYESYRTGYSRFLILKDPYHDNLPVGWGE